MKKVVLATVISGITLMACNSSNNKDSATNTMNHISAHTNGYVSPFTSPVNGILHIYIHIKNAFVNDDGKAAADEGNEMVKVLDNFDRSVLRDDERKLFEDIANDMRENAEQIGKNADNIKYQRGHFDMLSKNMYHLVKKFAAGQPVYVDSCPMYNDNQGATWLSETKEIRNPYFGEEMNTCVSMKEELK